jgi:hypothetical protein
MLMVIDVSKKRNKVLYSGPGGQLKILGRVEQVSERCLKRLAVDQKKQPTKEAVRLWLQTKLVERRPPPDPQQIRRELGWDLVVKVERRELPVR